MKSMKKFGAFFALLLCIAASSTQAQLPPDIEEVALHRAAETGDVRKIKQLLATGADVNASDNNNDWTPLHYAARQGHVVAVKVLLAADADVNAKSNIGWAPLHFATWEGHPAAVKALIEAGADVNSKTGLGRFTPLHLAAGYPAAIKALVAAGADVKAKDTLDDTPYEHCRIMHSRSQCEAWLKASN